VLEIRTTAGPSSVVQWLFKVLTDPFHNIALYWTSPFKLLRGELLDTGIADADWGNDDAEQALHLT